MRYSFFAFITLFFLIGFIGCYIPHWQNESEMNIMDFENEWEKHTLKYKKGQNEDSSKHLEYFQEK